MRIVSGKFKGHIFNPPKTIKARPTTDIAKEGLFNILSNRYDFDDIAVLDLFAGTGSISLEFASRGCASIHLVEMDFKHFAFIRKVIAELGINAITPIRHDAYKFIKNCTIQFDVIFADPPYDIKGFESIPDLIFSNNLLKNNGLLIVEHSKRTIMPENSHYTETRNYGNVHFSFYKS
ncbi:MAG: 16S rRNA (guanine(966)-N(2))-methyltransferase RsmD [Bacteroidales bacterium]|nr:16S rRNA (guanine(966)-N(2))-methyltransferase RsmD [Tenuifilaceae bacterium]